MPRKFIKKSDFIILACVAAAAAIGLGAVKLFSADGKTVTVKQGDTVIYKGSLFTEKTVKLQNNTVTVKNGEVYMSEASCKNQICAHTGKISRIGENIICLPNQVIIEIS